MYFFEKYEKCDFETLVAPNASGASPIDSYVLAGVFAMCLGLIYAPAARPTAENQKIYENFSCGTPHSMYVSAWP